MRKWSRILCAVLLIAAIPAILHAARVLPFQTRPLIEEKYAGWSGVLRIWIYEGWTGGSDLFAGWINRCIASYEKSHNGVYIQPKYVSADALMQMQTSGVRPPDMILFPPGLLTDGSGLAAISPEGVREPLQSCGAGVAVPVALGGYAWAYNRELLSADANWRDILPAAPTDEPFRRWSSALDALSSRSSAGEDTREHYEDPGIDLGLPVLATTSDVTTQFNNGELPAVLVTQMEIARLQRLSDQGKGPDWVVAEGATFTDQLLMLGVTASGDERESLSMEFAAHLLTEECQQMLSDYGAFDVIDAPTGYASASPYQPIDAALHSEALSVPPAFSGENPNVSSDPSEESGQKPE